VNAVKVTTVEPGYRVQLPAEWAAELGLRDFVTLERASGGILVRPYPAVTWDEVYADKLIPTRSPAGEEGVETVDGDDLLF
jgi:bifunctional DNA-binding transcriptional regulator/antitoxin component of YhaV-PrlF toxin-antitoxin module